MAFFPYWKTTYVVKSKCSFWHCETTFSEDKINIIWKNCVLDSLILTKCDFYSFFMFKTIFFLGDSCVENKKVLFVEASDAFENCRRQLMGKNNGVIWHHLKLIWWNTKLSKYLSAIFCFELCRLKSLLMTVQRNGIFK